MLDIGRSRDLLDEPLGTELGHLQAALETNKGTINLTLFADRVPFTVV